MRIAIGGVGVFAFSAACIWGLEFAGAAEQPAAPRDPAAIRQEIEAAQARIASLEREAAAAEVRQQQAQELADLKQQALERIPGLKSDLTEFAKATEGESTAAQRSQRDAQLSYYSALLALDEKIAALDGGTALVEAKALLQARDLVQTRWSLVTVPTTDRAVRLETLSAASRDANRGGDLVSRLRQMHEQDVKDAEAEFALREKRAKAEAEMLRLFEEAERRVAAE